MGSDIDLYIMDSSSGAMICARWIGQSETLKKVRLVLARKPDFETVGDEYWGRIKAMEALEISKASYYDGAGPEEIAKYMALYPDDKFWWFITHNY